MARSITEIYHELNRIDTICAALFALTVVASLLIALVNGAMFWLALLL